MRQPHEYENPACREQSGDADIWIYETRINQPQAKQICSTCDHKIECAEYGILHEVIGVWGGLNTNERAHLAAKRRIIRLPIHPTPLIVTKTRDNR